MDRRESLSMKRKFQSNVKLLLKSIKNIEFVKQDL
jgi:hypothetical protein